MEFEGEQFQLTEYQIKKTVKAFSYLDKTKKGLLKLDFLGDLMRCCGFNISLKEVENIKRLIVEGKDKEKEREEQKRTEMEMDEGNENKRDDEGIRSKFSDIEKTEIHHKKDAALIVGTSEESKKEFNKSNANNNDESNISKLLSDLKNYDNFMEIEKKKEELKKIEEENRSLFSIKEYLRVIQIPDITKNIKPPTVLAAFENFDTKGNGKISVKKLRFILQYLGEPFSNAEFDEFFEWMKTLNHVCKDEEIIYEDLLNELINKEESI